MKYNHYTARNLKHDYNIFNWEKNMKFSNKIILGIAIGVFALILLFGISFRINLRRFGIAENNNIGTAVITRIPVISSQQIKDLNLAKINHLVINGIINITVKRGQNAKLKLIANGINTLKLYQENNTLHIKGLKRSNIKITLPKLNNISITGMSHLKLIGFQASQFKLEVAGMSSATGINNKFTNLHLNCTGRSNVDLSKNQLVNATVNVTGQSNVKLNMQNGNLTGNVTGMSSLQYSGQIKNRKLTIIGMSNVMRLRQ